MIDIRLPIGGLFAILGLMLAGYGVMTSGNEMYVIKSMGININLWWGLAMVVFGGLMLFFGMVAGSKKSPPTAQTAEQRDRVGSHH